MLIGCLIVVALSTGFLPFLQGCGTELSLSVILLAWYIIEYADENLLVYLAAPATINLLLFSLVALPLYFILRRRAPMAVSLALSAWLLFYLGCLLVLFPATDCP